MHSTPFACFNSLRSRVPFCEASEPESNFVRVGPALATGDPTSCEAHWRAKQIVGSFSRQLDGGEGLEEIKSSVAAQ
jgi:hypothetical protein